MALHENGALERYNVELIGANVDSIEIAEDRQLFKDAMTEIGLELPAQRSRQHGRGRRCARGNASAIPC